jgi:hypothetical protein
MRICFTVCIPHYLPNERKFVQKISFCSRREDVEIKYAFCGIVALLTKSVEKTTLKIYAQLPNQT